MFQFVSVFIFILISSSLSHAKFSQYLCMTEFPTTSIALSANGNLMDVQVVHHNGIQYMPIHDGLVTSYDLTTLTERAGLLTKLPEYWLFSWPMESCKFHDREIFSCFGGTSVYELNGVKVHPYGVYSSRVTDESFAGKFQTIKVSLYLDIDGRSQIMSMNYQVVDCGIQD
ncbi:MAG: hypothetical protein BroJett040_19140 [Oligoflexia bacterium]|nr:MAG: hypothetical protein BroJett040_19140 [Oligoflexia bacterium]